MNSSWTCDGVPKDGKDYPDCSGEHEPYENYGPDCVVCGLPREAMQEKRGGASPSWLKPTIVAAIAALFIVGGGFATYQLVSSRRGDDGTDSEAELVSQTVSTSSRSKISQGEKILLELRPDKEAGAEAFAIGDWEEAIARYESAAGVRPPDPESAIYQQNAEARKAGNPLTIAVVVPISDAATGDGSINSAKEILRGVALYQSEYNDRPGIPARLLEVAIADDANPLETIALAEDLAGSPILGVIGHGIGPTGEAAIRIYNDNSLPAISPINTSVSSDGSDRSILQTVSLDEKANELLQNYLQAASQSLTKYAERDASIASAFIFYNASSPYSQRLSEELQKAIQQAGGSVANTIDIERAGFEPEAALESAAENEETEVAFLALSKNKVERAIAIARSNADSDYPLQLMGGDELYNPTLLLEGDEAIEGMVLSVPWRFQPKDPFAANAAQSWKGRVSWRTAAAYDATKALADAIVRDPERAKAARLLERGLEITGTNTDFRIFDNIPLVTAAPGPNGPQGSNYQFDPIE